MVIGYLYYPVCSILKTNVNYYVEIENRNTLLDDKVLFNGRYIMERQVAERNLNNPHPIQVWSPYWFAYEKNGIERFDVNCAVQYNWYAKRLHRKIIKCLR